MTKEDATLMGGSKILRGRGSTRSLTRQRRVRSVENVCATTQLGESSPASSVQSIPELSHASSARSSSPIGDFQAVNGQGTVLQRAAWFLSSENRQIETEPERPRGLLGMGRTIQRTGSQLRKTRLYHIFYICVLPLYTLLGAWIFKYLDGEHDDRLILEYKNRCQFDRQDRLDKINAECVAGGDCFQLMKAMLNEVEQCYRNWHQENRTITHSMNDFTNSMVFAFSVYTTIGYGNMAADTVKCRLATILYGALGIPLFFAFVKEAGNLCRHGFISSYNMICKLKDRYCICDTKDMVEDESVPTVENGNGAAAAHRPVILISEGETKHARFSRKYSTNSLFGTTGKLHLDEQRRVFIAGVVVFVLYILLVSWIFSITTEFDYVTSVYFLFNSVALIGFGDVFPTNPTIILLNTVFIVLGVVLFSMCYFILQEEIRNQAFEASRRARISISKYSHTIMQHASRSAWSRRNSPLLENSPETAFDRMRKRRQSAPAVTLTVPPRVPR